MNDRKLYLRLMSHVWPYWQIMSISIFLLVLLAATEPLFPALIKPLLDEGFVKKDQEFINLIPYILVGLFILRGALSFTSTYAAGWLANKLVADIRNLLIQRLVRLPVYYFDSHSSGRLASHVIHDAGAVTGAATQSLTIITRDSLTLIGLIGWLLWLDWFLTSITLAIAPLIAISIKYFNKRLRINSKKHHVALAELTHRVEEIATNNRIMKIFNAETFEFEKFKKLNEKQRQISMKSTVAGSALTPVVQLLVSMSVAIVVSIALNSSGSATSTAGGFMSFLTALLMLLPPIKRLTDISSVIQRGLAAAELIFSILDQPEEKYCTKTSTEKSSKYIAITDLTFRYPEAEKDTLTNFNLEIEKGQKIALVGPSGGGKSTITSLLTGFYPYDKGEIIVNGKKSLPRCISDSRELISLVAQDTKLFNDTILYNVSYPDETPNIIKAHEALNNANALDFVNKLEHGIHTHIGQNGVKLSGGQRQRIAIARAFYKDAPILILDEATSALDNESERAIQRSTDQLADGRTSIIIAHRLSTIINADRIIYIEDGKILESGKHQDLLSLGGPYSKQYLLSSTEK